VQILTGSLCETHSLVHVDYNISENTQTCGAPTLIVLGLEILLIIFTPCDLLLKTNPQSKEQGSDQPLKSLAGTIVLNAVL